MTNTVVDERIYKTSVPARMLVTVISGTPSLSFSLDGFDTETVIDLTASPTYPAAEISLPACKYKFDLNGAVVQKTAALPC